MIDKRFGVLMLILFVIIEAFIIYYLGFSSPDNTEVNNTLIEQHNKAIEIKEANNAINANFELQKFNYYNNLLINTANYEKIDSSIMLLGADSTIELLTINLSNAIRAEWRYASGDNDTTSKANK